MTVFLTLDARSDEKHALVESELTNLPVTPASDIRRIGVRLRNWLSIISRRGLVCLYLARAPETFSPNANGVGAKVCPVDCAHAVGVGAKRGNVSFMAA